MTEHTNGNIPEQNPRHRQKKQPAYLRKSKPKKWPIILLAALALMICAFGIYVITDPYDCRIAPNVQAGGLEIGGMSLPEAYQAMDRASAAVLESTVLEVALPQETVYLSPADTHVRLNTAKALWTAYRAGRVESQSHAIGLKDCLKLDEAYIRDTLRCYADRYNTDLTSSSYRLSGETPDLELEGQDSRNCQTLELTMGLPTARLDQEDAFERIMAVYDSAFSAAAKGEYRVTDHFRVDILEEPHAPDLDAIYAGLSIAPVDDSLDMEQYVPIPGAYGYGFDLEQARTLVAEAEYGQTLSIPMMLVEPEISGDAVFFRDVLGYCETPHTKDENRNNNLRRACESMNGVILQPGEVFSYNETLGERTKENGYLKAGAYSGWELVQSYGGGICQGSSTIYCAVLYADLEIVFRVNHGYAVSYIDYGLDATVSWNGPDFQFRNNTHFPVKIAAEVSDGYVKVAILGTEERDYYVEMESEAGIGDSVIYARSYKCKYDRETGELISRELEARSNYSR